MGSRTFTKRKYVTVPPCRISGSGESGMCLVSRKRHVKSMGQLPWHSGNRGGFCFLWHQNLWSAFSDNRENVVFLLPKSLLFTIWVSTTNSLSARRWQGKLRPVWAMGLQVNNNLLLGMPIVSFSTATCHSQMGRQHSDHHPDCFGLHGLQNLQSFSTQPFDGYKIIVQLEQHLQKQDSCNTGRSQRLSW